jgi:hypothetical protein
MILTLSVTASAQTPNDGAAPNKIAISEGFPAAQLQRLKNRDAALRAHSQGSYAAVQAVISPLKTWSAGELPVKVAFLGGSDELRGQIVAAVTAWSAGSGIRFDFGTPGAFREWTRQDQAYKAQIRIAFDEAGYWSFVGADSIDPSVAGPNEASMSFQDFTTALPDDWQGVVRHEFGHAISFQHEHQSPVAHCDTQFRWNDDPGYVSTTDIYGQFIQDPQGRRPGIYTVLGGPPNNWPRAQIDANLRQLPATVDIRYTAFDPKSVMMYSFAGWMFVNGAQSPCYTAENLTPSAVDLNTAAAAYPLAAAAPTISPSTLHAARTLAAKHNLPDQIQQQLQQRLAQFQ